METANKSLFRITRNQAVLLGVLAAVLCGVIATSFESGEPAVETAADQPEPARRPRPGVDSTEPAHAASWPEISLAEMLLHNPFAAMDQKPSADEAPPAAEIEVTVDTPVETPPVEPTPDPRAALAEREARKEAALTAFRDQKIRFILRTGRISSAMLGERVVHENDVVDGIRILSIRPDGISVKWVGE